MLRESDSRTKGLSGSLVMNIRQQPGKFALFHQFGQFFWLRISKYIEYDEKREAYAEIKVMISNTRVMNAEGIQHRHHVFTPRYGAHWCVSVLFCEIIVKLVCSNKKKMEEKYLKTD